MKGYAELEVFTRAELLALKEAKRIVRHFPTHDRQGRWVRCHEVARVVGSLLGLQVCDGSYGLVEHSWLWTTPCPHYMGPMPNVLDCYVVGRLPAVQLCHTQTPGTFEYRRGNPRRDVRPTVLEELYQRVRARL